LHLQRALSVGAVSVLAAMMCVVPRGVRPSDAVYTPEQKAALALHYHPPEVSSRRVAELAAAGKLTGPDGRRLAPFEANTNTIRSIARRVQRGRDLDGMDGGSAQRLYARLAARARRLAVAAKTSKEIEAAAKALEAAEKLRGEIERKPASGETLGGSILDAHRGGRPAPPEPLPKTEPKPKAEPPPPEPTPDPREEPGRWMRAQVAALAAEQHPKPPAPPEHSVVGLDVSRPTYRLEPELYDVSDRRPRHIRDAPDYAYPRG
jgi:hypothetical protein